MNLAHFVNNLLALEGDEPEAPGKTEMKYLPLAGWLHSTPGLTRKMELFGAAVFTPGNKYHRAGGGGVALVDIK